MCTLIASIDKNKFIVGMNRDDKPERTHKSYYDGDIFYPIDATRQGTWIGVSRDGSVAALLNRGNSNGVRTRGELVPHFLKNHGFSGIELELYTPFTLLFYDNTKRLVSVYNWSNSHLTQNELSDSTVVLTSSGYGVAEERKKIIMNLIDRKKVDEKQLTEILKSHLMQRGVVSPCMHGPRSETIGSTIITVRNNYVEVDDAKGSPCTVAYQRVKEWKLL